MDFVQALTLERLSDNMLVNTTNFCDAVLATCIGKSEVCTATNIIVVPLHKVYCAKEAFIREEERLDHKMKKDQDHKEVLCLCSTYCGVKSYSMYTFSELKKAASVRALDCLDQTLIIKQYGVHHWAISHFMTPVLK